MCIYTCIYTEDSGTMHRKMVTAAEETNGRQYGKERSFHNLNVFVSLKLCTRLINLKVILKQNINYKLNIHDSEKLQVTSMSIHSSCMLQLRVRMICLLFRKVLQVILLNRKKSHCRTMYLCEEKKKSQNDTLFFYRYTVGVYVQEVTITKMVISYPVIHTMRKTGGFKEKFRRSVISYFFQAEYIPMSKKNKI